MQPKYSLIPPTNQWFIYTTEILMGDAEDNYSCFFLLFSHVKLDNIFSVQPYTHLSLNTAPKNGIKFNVHSY